MVENSSKPIRPTRGARARGAGRPQMRRTARRWRRSTRTWCARPSARPCSCSQTAPPSYPASGKASASPVRRPPLGHTAPRCQSLGAPRLTNTAPAGYSSPPLLRTAACSAQALCFVQLQQASHCVPSMVPAPAVAPAQRAKRCSDEGRRAEASARTQADALVPAVEQLVGKVTRLYEGTSMPVSDVCWLPAAPKT